MENLDERLDAMQSDILKAREKISKNLEAIERCVYFIPMKHRDAYSSAVRSSRIELLRLNNALQQIKNIRHFSNVAYEEKVCACQTFDLANSTINNAYLSSDGFLHTLVKCPDEKFCNAMDKIKADLKEQMEFAERHTE